MASGEMTIGELADAAGVSRRAVRFYVQRGLLAAPLGLGRGRHYDASHLEQLRRIREMQEGGHSLDAIARVMGGGSVVEPVAQERVARRPRAALSAALWTRLRVAEGVEVHYDATKFNPEVA